METQKICPSCQKTLAPDLPMGLCPECLIRAGFATGVESNVEVAGHRFTPPSLQELSERLPHLEILEFIGQGGMGAVYKARQKELDRVVALKILPPDIGVDPAFAERFSREARALARLNHPGIVTIHDFGKAAASEPGHPVLFYFLMEYVDGVTLRHLLNSNRIAAREALAIVPQICDALQYAHDQGIVHRDIKPENILLDRRGRVKVADFGLAKLVEHNREEGRSDSTGNSMTASLHATATADGSKIMGTPQYMAPEQIHSPGSVDHRADIYAVGVVFYQMLTGELPGKQLEPPSARMAGVQIDVRLDEVVLRALEKNPERRYQQASILKTQVETIISTPEAERKPSGTTTDERVQPTTISPGQINPSEKSSQKNGRSKVSMWIVTLAHGVCLLLIIGLLSVVLPRTVEICQSFGLPLPLVTAFCFNMVQLTVHYGIILIPAILAIDWFVCLLLDRFLGRLWLWVYGCLAVVFMLGMGVFLVASTMLPISKLTQSVSNSTTTAISNPPLTLSDSLSLSCGGNDGPTQWLDLDTGKIIAKPSGWMFASPMTQEKNRLPGFGVYAAQNQFNAVSVGMVLLHGVANERWKDCSASDLRNELDKVDVQHKLGSRSPGSDMMMMASETTKWPKTYMFRTPSGTLGLIHLLRSDNPGEVTLLWKKTTLNLNETRAESER